MQERAEEVREADLKEKGFLTLHDELALLSQQLSTISQRIKGLELKEERDQQRATEPRVAQEPAAV